MATQTKCPFCAEEIQPEALKCRHCGEWLDGPGHGRGPNGRPADGGNPDSFAYGAQVAGGGTPRPTFRMSQQSIIIAAGIALIVALGAVLLLAQNSRRVSDALVGAPTDDSSDRAAQSDLRNALVAAKTMYTDTSSYANADSSSTGLVTVEPALCYVPAATPSVPVSALCVSGIGAASISVTASDTSWAAARMSDSGRCWWIRDEAAVGTSYGEGATCTGTAAAAGATSPAFPTDVP